MRASVVCTLLFVLVAGCGDGERVDMGGSTGSDGFTPRPFDTHLPPGCDMDEPAFCETFDEPSPGGRGGELDDENWSFTRWGSVINKWFGRPTSSSANIGYDIDGNYYSSTDSSNADIPTMCGELFEGVDSPNDVRVCGGQLNEVFNDYGSLVLNSMRIRQPFDFTDRTGKIVFDVDAKRNDGWDGHGWWLEVWISEDPTPVPYHGAPTVGSYTARGAVGFQILPSGLCFSDVTMNNVGRIVELDENDVVSDRNIAGECFKVKDTRLNRFHVLLSQTKIEILASDYDSDELKPVVSYDLDLKFSIGYVHFQHVHYNAGKTPNAEGKHATSTQAFRWDNIGFDGPVYPTPRAYDVPEDIREALTPTCGGCPDQWHVGVLLGYDLVNGADSIRQRFAIGGVDLTDALHATLNFNAMAAGGQELRYRLNGHDWHIVTVPEILEGWLLKTFSEEVPVEDLVDGSNVLEIERLPDGPETIGNIDLTIDTSK